MGKIPQKEKQPGKGCFSIRKWDVNIFMEIGDIYKPSLIGMALYGRFQSLKSGVDR